MRDDDERATPHQQDPQQAGRGGLFALLRRIITPRPPEVLVMERDGQLRRSTWPDREE